MAQGPDTRRSNKTPIFLFPSHAHTIRFVAGQNAQTMENLHSVGLLHVCRLVPSTVHKDAQHPLPILNPDWTDAKRNTIWSCAIYSKILLDLACFFFCPEWLTVMLAKKKMKSHEISNNRAKIKGFIPADGPSPLRSGGAEPFIGVFFLSQKNGV